MNGEATRLLTAHRKVITGSSPVLAAMIKKIKDYFRKRREAEEIYWNNFSKSIDNAAFGPGNAVCELVGMPHLANEVCDKCKHLAGQELTKELYLEIFKLHNIAFKSG